MAKINAATAATDKPAICAGVILGGSSVATAAGAGVVDAEVVADGKVEIESTMTDCVELV
jgi:hypothetical protein